MANESGVFKSAPFVRLSLDKEALLRYNIEAGKNFGKALAFQFRNSPKTGRVYNGIRASAPGEYPAVRSGRLLKSIRSYGAWDEVTFGTNMKYSRYLAEGTINMAKRRMSKAIVKDFSLREYERYFPNFIRVSRPK